MLQKIIRRAHDMLLAIPGAAKLLLMINTVFIASAIGQVWVVWFSVRRPGLRRIHQLYNKHEFIPFGGGVDGHGFGLGHCSCGEPGEDQRGQIRWAADLETKHAVLLRKSMAGMIVICWISRRFVRWILDY